MLLVQPPGNGSAGLSAGFMAPLNVLHIVLLGFIGVWGVTLGPNASLMLPLTFLLMVVIASLLEIDTSQMPPLRIFIFGSILLFAFCISSIQNRLFLLSASFSSSLAFHLGGYYIQSVPSFASPLYFLVGMVLCSALVLAAGVSLGLALLEEITQLKAKLKQLPAIASLMSLF